MSTLVFFDSNILIDHLNRVSQASRLLNEHAECAAISAVVWMEVLTGVVGTVVEQTTREMLEEFVKIEIDSAIQERAVRVRRDYRMKLLDALIYATAEEHEAVLYTRDGKDFPPNDSRIVVPYTL